jgi:hypothetical protein
MTDPARGRVDTAGVERRGPVTAALASLWTLARELADSGYGNRPTAIRLCGPLDVARLERSCGLLAARHPALRTVFRAVGGAPVQEIRHPAGLELPVIDVSRHLDPAGSLRRIADERIRVPFDLTRESAFDPVLVRTAPDHHVLHVRLHQIVFDGWSERVLLHDLSHVYSAVSRGEEPALPRVGVDLVDLANEQRRRHEDGTDHDAVVAWERVLRDLPLPVEVPARVAATGPPAGPLGTVDTVAPSHVVERATVLLRARRVTLYVGLLSTYLALLARYTDRTDVVVGAPVSARTRHEYEGVIGYLANELPIRVDVAGDLSFDELLERANLAFRDALSRQDVPLAQVIPTLQSRGVLASDDLFSTTIQLRSFPPVELAPSPVSMALVTVPHGPGILHLRIHVLPERGLTVRVYHDEQVYDREAARRLGRDLITLLDQATRDPHRPLADLTLGGVR